MKKIAASLFVALFVSSAHAVPVLVNGSLNGSITNGGVPSGWNNVAGSPDTMDQNNNVGVAGLGQFQAAPSASPDGGTWVGFARQNSFIETFGQVVSGFDVGTSYDLSWFHGNFGYAAYDGVNSIEVLLDNVVIASGPSLGLGTGWVDEMISFTATSASHRIDFRLQDAEQAYHSIDGVRLAASGVTPPTTGVSEPATLALLGLGLVGLAGLRKKKAA